MLDLCNIHVAYVFSNIRVRKNFDSFVNKTVMLSPCGVHAAYVSSTSIKKLFEKTKKE